MIRLTTEHPEKRLSQTRVQLAARTPACRSKQPKRRAAAAVEFAVVGLVFFPLILGILEIGRGLMVGHLLTVAAGRGCRTAVVEGRADSDVATTIQTTLDVSRITGWSKTVQVNNVTKNCSTAVAGDEITVIVSVPVSSVTWVPGGHFLTGNISAQYTLIRE